MIKPILVTGSHRSGTTWVGQMLAMSPTIVYIEEPFNLDHYTPSVCTARFKYWFTYISEENEQDFFKPLKETLSFRNMLKNQIYSGRPLHRLKRIGQAYLRLLRYQGSRMRPLMKDPIALFSSEWLAARFNMDVVILIRHPAAFVGSLKIKNWTYPFSHFLQQPLLMKRYLLPFKTEIQQMVEKPHDVIDQAALLWKLCYYMVLTYQQVHADWIFLRHEDLSKNPAAEFQHLFTRLSLAFSEPIEQAIQWHSDASNTADSATSNNYFTELRRNSRSNILTWKNRLTEDEVNRIKHRVQDVSKYFYSENEW